MCFSQENEKPKKTLNFKEMVPTKRLKDSQEDDFQNEEDLEL
jgi:hypothetical protein